MEDKNRNNSIEELRKKALETDIKNCKVLSVTSGITASLAALTLLVEVTMNFYVEAAAIGGYAIYFASTSIYNFQKAKQDKKDLENLKNSQPLKDEFNASKEIKEQLYTLRNYIERIKLYRNNGMLNAIGMGIASISNFSQAINAQDSILKLTHIALLVATALISADNLKTTISTHRKIKLHQVMLEILGKSDSEIMIEENIEEGPKLTHKQNKNIFSN